MWREVKFWAGVVLIIVCFLAAATLEDPHDYGPPMPACPTDDADLTGCVWDCATMGNKICGPTITVEGDARR